MAPGVDKQLTADMFVRYLLVLAMLAVLSVLSYLTLHAVVTSHENSAVLIDLGTKQRGLVQRVAVLAGRLVVADQFKTASAIRDEMLDSLEQIEKARLAVVGKPATGAADALYSQPPVDLDTRLAAFTARARVLALGGGPVAASDPDYAYILDAADHDLAGAIETVIAHHQNESETQIDRMVTVAQVGLGLTLLILLFSAVKVFDPLVRYIEQRMRDLYDVGARLRAILNSAANGIVTIDSNGRIDSFNLAAEQMFGLPAREAIGQPAAFLVADGTEHSFIPRDVRVGQPLADEAAEVETREVETREVIGQRRGGGLFPMDVRVTELHLGHNLLYTCILRDITERKLAEQAVHDSELRFRDFAEAASDWFWEMGADGRFTHISGNFPYDHGIIVGRPMVQVATHWKADGDALKHLLDDLDAQRAFRGFSFRLHSESGGEQVFKISGKPVRDEHGAFGGYRGSGADITESRMAEEQLRLAATVFDSSFTAIMVTDAAGAILKVNQAFCRITGYASGEVVGVKPSLLKSDRHSPEFFAAMWNGLAARRMWQGEIWNRRKNGEVYPEWLEISAVMGAGGVVSNYVGMFTDITRRKAADAQIAEDAAELGRKNVELEHALLEAREGSRAKSEFLAAMSHELRTPLNAIIGFSEVMEGEMMGPIGNEAYKGYAHDINHSGQHLLGIINDILDVSRVEALDLVVTDDEIAIEQAVVAAIRLVHERAENAKVEVVAEIPANLPSLRADARSVKQILLNLLSNAVKFTPEGGRVVCSAGIDSDGRFVLTIADNGIGIAADDLPKAMALFGQVDSRLARKYDGAGLGLPLTKSCVEAHGGSLRIDSIPNVGTTVHAYFPKERVVLTPNRGSR